MNLKFSGHIAQSGRQSRDDERQRYIIVIPVEHNNIAKQMHKKLVNVEVETI